VFINTPLKASQLLQHASKLLVAKQTIPKTIFDRVISHDSIMTCDQPPFSVARI